MSISEERNTPSHGALATPSHRQHRPPDVEEALSSMLWTPYERTTPTASSSDEEDDDDERLNRQLRKSQSNYETSTSHLMPLLPGTGTAAAASPIATTTTTAPPVPFPNFSLSGCAFEAAKTSRAGGSRNRNRNRYSYPTSFYGSPAHTLTQWCSSAATAIKEPPSYESLYEASASGVGVARASLARVQPNNLQCDRSQRSRATAAATRDTDPHNDQDDVNDDELTANVPAERLVRSFTDDYISQNCALFTPAINDTEKATATTTTSQKQKPTTTTNARSQQSAENQSDSRANSIINEISDKDGDEDVDNDNDDNVGDEQEIATTTTNEETGTVSASAAVAVAVQVNQPVSCAAAAAATLNRTLSLSQSLSRSRSHCVRDKEHAALRASTQADESGSTQAAERASTQAAERASTQAAERAATASGCSIERRSPVISLSSSFGACTTDAYSNGSSFNKYNNTLSSWLSRGRYNYNSCSSSSSDALRPNKCLAELERLYAEFRASESLFEHRLSQSHIDSDNDSDIDIETMRLNVSAELPPATATAATQTAHSNNNNNSSSVFLKASNSNDNDRNSNKQAKSVSSIAILPAATKSCQRQPSLTIQVNNGSSSNYGANNGNQICVASPTNTTATATVTTTTVAAATQESNIVNNNNGVCVVNCNYNNSSNTPNHSNNNNNNNNDNSSIVAINNCVPASKVFSASVQNKLNNNPNVDVQHVAATDSSGSVSVSATNNNNNNNANNNNNNCHENGNVNVNVSSVENSVKVINVNASTPRTFTSTECQTDDLNHNNNNNNNNNSSSNSSQQQQQQQLQQQQLQQQQLRTREQRRRERRERRQQHQQQQQQQQQLPPHHPRRPPPHLHHPHPHPHPSHHPAALGLARALLPDILHSHYPPPYSALPAGAPPPPLPPPPQAAPPLPPLPPPPAPQAPVPVPMLTPVISTVPLPGAAPLMSDGRFTLPLPIMRRSPSERSGKGCCGQWFAGPPLRALIAVVALGGVACALGGAALGATGLAGPPNSHLTAALLMIGVGVVLVTVSGAAWRMTAPGGQSCLGLGTSVDLARCGRRPCTRGGGAPHGLLYPEFQHRPPPPSYQASMQEYRLRLLLLDRDRQNGVVRGNSPPPTYRSHAGSLLRAPLTTLRSGIGGGGGGGTISSSMGGSEYSLPPSYRSRNATPASLTLSSERTIETAPSGRLLANEDLPEPSAEQLPDYSALQSNTLLTSAIVEIESRNRSQSQDNATKSPATTTTTTSTTTKAKDLVTIVTISQANSSSGNSPNVQPGGRAQTQVPAQLPGQASALDQIDILAHL